MKMIIQFNKLKQKLLDNLQLSSNDDFKIDTFNNDEIII